MATDDSNAHGRAGQAFSDKDGRKRLDNFNLSKASLQNLEYTLNGSLDVVQKAQGKRNDTIQRLCDLVGISKQTLAKAIIFEAKGDISCVELSRKLNLHKSTLRKRNWHDVRKLIVSKI